jgi:UPF0271 protein
VAPGRRIDLNADVGEGEGTDAALIALVTSVNVACGAHAGDTETMRRTLEVAAGHGVAVGAHPGYPDREGFGRRDLDLSPAELRATLRQQLLALRAVALSAGVDVGHVKPHGALYNRAAADLELARRVAGIVLDTLGPVVLVGLAGSALLTAGRASGLPVAAEAFADRAYEPDGSLRPRTRPGAVLVDPAAVARQALAIALDGRILLEDGRSVTVDADTLCLHGDTPGALEHARVVREALASAGVEVVALGAAASG